MKKFFKDLAGWYLSDGKYDQMLIKYSITIQLVLLSLSLIHQTNAVSEVTGMTWWLALMQAVVQDFGLFVAELILIRFQQTGKPVIWAVLFVFFAAVASGSANVYDFTSRLEPWSVKWWLSAVYGASVPLQVLLLGKLVSQLVDVKKPSNSSHSSSGQAKSSTSRSRKRES
jgi:hypothetical protein